MVSRRSKAPLRRATSTCPAAPRNSSAACSGGTIGDPIQSRDDVITRFGRRSEIRWLFESYVQVDSDAMMYAIAVPENGSGATASVDFTFTTTATARGNILIENMGNFGSSSITILIRLFLSSLRRM
jgi:phage tail sheath gpL-like